ncbi:MAG: hypothetical protein WA004_20455 [Saprospiraceae bacterium]
MKTHENGLLNLNPFAMTEDEKGKSLHDRASRGEILTEEERQFLKRWYAKMDLEELVSFNIPKEPETIGLLKTQINAVVARLDKTVNRIQQIVITNRKLRAENTWLKSQINNFDNPG